MELDLDLSSRSKAHNCAFLFLFRTRLEFLLFQNLRFSFFQKDEEKARGSSQLRNRLLGFSDVIKRLVEDGVRFWPICGYPN